MVQSTEEFAAKQSDGISKSIAETRIAQASGVDMLEKFNAHHDNKGRFTTGGNSHQVVPQGGIGAHTTQYGAEFHQNVPRAMERVALATSHEPAVTGAVKMLQGAGAELVGLDFCLKGLDSTTRKIVGDAHEQKKSFRQSANSIADGLRYTLQVPAGSYAGKITDSLKQLEAAGYKVVTFKNSWGATNKNGLTLYQGVNTNLTTPSGFKFELQFHTKDSFVTKDKTNHHFYEEERLPNTTPARKLELQRIMHNNQAKVPVPAGVSGLSWKL